MINYDMVDELQNRHWDYYGSTLDRDRARKIYEENASILSTEIDAVVDKFCYNVLERYQNDLANDFDKQEY